MIEALRERIVQITDELLAALPMPGSNEPFDVMAGLAQPLPVRVICDVLGLPAQEFAQTKAGSDTLALMMEPVQRKAWRQSAATAGDEMVACLRATRNCSGPTRHRSGGR